MGPSARTTSVGYQLRFNNGVPFQLNTRNTPAKGLNYSKYFGIYGQDSWTLARRVTLNLGLRFDHESAYAPDQCREASAFSVAQCFDEFHLNTFNSLGPRAHVAFDVMGDGKTVIKGGYGRFNQLRELQPDLTSHQSECPRDDDLGLARYQRQQAVPRPARSTSIRRGRTSGRSRASGATSTG